MKGFIIIAPLIVVIALGMLLKMCGFLRPADRDSYTRVLYWVALPALLFRTTYLNGGDIGSQKNVFLAVYASMFILPFVAVVLSCLFTHRGDRNRQALSAMASFRSNNVYLGLPAVTLALGEPGMAAASMFLAISLPGYNIISITWGEVVHSRELSLRALRTTAVKLLKNPLIVSCLFGLLCAQIRVPVPNTLLISLKLLADTTTGVALLLLGSSLELPNLIASFKRTWSEVLIKLVLHPAVVWALLLMWPVDRVMMQTAVIISAMPTAVNTFIVAAGMGLDEQYACEIVAATTCLAMVTIPIWVALVGVH